MSIPEKFEILFIDDDAETIEQMKRMEIEEISGHPVAWDYCNSFDEAIERIGLRRYDIVVSDIYQDREGHRKNIQDGDVRAGNIVSKIREERFCPVVLYTDGSIPENLVEEPFVLCANKGAASSDELSTKISEVIATGLPVIARRLHDDIDRSTGSYVWSYVSKNWDQFHTGEETDTKVLEGLVRRRAALQIDRISSNEEERTTATAADYYVIPPIGRDLKLGSLLVSRVTGEYRVVLTPHCHLITQPGQQVPRADFT